jgi:dUTP pyrophosphatase
MRFEKVSYESFRKEMLRCGYTEECIHGVYENIKLPERKTEFSAGYDISVPVRAIIKPGERTIIPIGIKAVFNSDEARSFHLEIHVRSSVGIRRGLVLANGTAIIDSDYAENPDNEGCLMVALWNTSDETVRLECGERVAQGIFAIHGIASNDNAKGERTGGIGSTNERSNA